MQTRFALLTAKCNALKKVCDKWFGLVSLDLVNHAHPGEAFND